MLGMREMVTLTSSMLVVAAAASLAAASVLLVSETSSKYPTNSVESPGYCTAFSKFQNSETQQSTRYLKSSNQQGPAFTVRYCTVMFFCLLSCTVVDTRIRVRNRRRIVCSGSPKETQRRSSERRSPSSTSTLQSLRYTAPYSAVGGTLVEHTVSTEQYCELHCYCDAMRGLNTVLCPK